MSPWQRRARLALAVVALGVIGAVGYTIRPREARTPPPIPERIDPKATVETRGGDVIQLKGERQDLRVEFEGQVTYEDGHTKLLGVKISVENRGGRSYTVTGQEARIGANQSSFEVTGNVVLTTNDGLTATSRSAAYTDAEKIVRAPGPVTFTRGRLSGSGVGFTFDEQRDTLWLLDQAVVKMAPDGDRGAMDVTAGAFGFARRDRYMRFERTLHLIRDGQVIDANEATVHLLADRDEPDLMELRGDARVSGGAGIGALRSLAARDINLDYREDGRSLKQATLAGQTELQLAGPGGSAGQRLSGDWMDVTLAEDGAVQTLASRDNVQVTIPATRDAAARTIRATALSATGAPGGLSAMRFQEGVEYREAATRTRGPRSARARTLAASLVPATGALDEARFNGGFSFDDGGLHAESGEALYRIAAGTLALTSRPGERAPFVADPSIRIDAQGIDVTLAPRAMAAKDRVATVLQPTAKAAPGGAAAKRPGLLGDRDPVTIAADTLAYDESARRGVYTGHARLFQGDTVIQADTLTIDEAKGDLAAEGKVFTSLVIAGNATPEGAKPRATIVRAGTFAYGDATRAATFTTAAHMNGEQADLHASTIALVLAAGENRLARLEAEGAVQATVDRRQVTGARLAYDPDGDKYVVTGAPVTMVDAECQRTTGKTLTFFKASDRVLVDGNEEVRTETKGGGKCPVPPPD